VNDGDEIDVSAMLGPCVYKLKLAGEVVYVGQSRRPISRLYAHKNAWEAKRRGRPTPGWLSKQAIKFDAVVVIPTPIARLDEVERALIAQWLPKHNVKHKPPIIRAPIVLQMRSGVTVRLNDEAAKVPPPPFVHPYAGMVRRI
jgi:hypothetical protein